MKTFLTLLTVFSIFVLDINSSAQSVANKFPEAISVTKSKGELCESNNSLMDAIAMMLSMDEKALLYVIAHGGTNESQSVIKQRLDHTKVVLLGVKRFDKERIIFATGDKVKGQSKLDFYVGSQLFLVINMKKNRSVCFLTPDYSGPGDKLSKRR